MGKRGRPRKQLDWAKVDVALSLGANMSQVAGYCDVSHVSVQAAVQREKGMTFAEYREHRMAGTNLKVTQKLLQIALAGNLGAIIWWQKNNMGWSDKTEHAFDKDKKTIVLKYGLQPKDEEKDDE